MLSNIRIYDIVLQVTVKIKLRNMLKRIKLFFLKLDLLISRVNSRLPRILRITKFGIVTTFISLILSVTVVYAQSEERANLDIFSEKQLTFMAKNAALGLGSRAYNAQTGDSSTGATYYLNELISRTYEETDQISAVAYIQNELENAGIVRPVQAQATGYVMMRPVLNLWKAVRNISLGFIVVAGLILAVMILLRVRSGQDYVTILNALPKLVVTIVLIIFSYSLGGLMLDYPLLVQRL